MPRACPADIRLGAEVVARGSSRTAGGLALALSYWAGAFCTPGAAVVASWNRGLERPLQHTGDRDSPAWGPQTR
jgi:hypothetical protein